MSTTWPEGVIARYLTVGGATVDILDKKDEHDEHDEPGEYVARCTGCTADWSNTRSGWNLEFQVRPWAQGHAEKCRAMPKPEATR
jgi:hypothetical protein